MLRNHKLGTLGLTLAVAAVLMFGTVGTAEAEVIFNIKDQDVFELPGCDEDVIGLLNFHVVIAATSDAAGGEHLTAHIKLHGFAEGEDSGARYRVNAGFPFIPIPNRDNDNAGGASNFSFELFDVNVIGLGKTPDLHLSLRFQSTTNANGDVVMEKEILNAHGCNI